MAAPLATRFPKWRDRRGFQMAPAGEQRLSELLNHLSVLLPVLDDQHSCVDESEVEKLLAEGEGWLETHPARDSIVRRSLQHKGRLARRALERLVADESPEVDAEDQTRAAEEVRAVGSAPAPRLGGFDFSLLELLDTQL